MQHNKVPALEIKFPALLRRESRRRRLERRGEREEGEVCSATREDAYRQAHHFGLVQNTGTAARLERTRTDRRTTSASCRTQGPICFEKPIPELKCKSRRLYS